MPRLAPPRVRLSAPRSRPVEMPYDVRAASRHVTRLRALFNIIGVVYGFDDNGRRLPAEMLPGEIPFAGVRFKPHEQRALVSKFFDYLEANAEDFWQAPQLEITAGTPQATRKPTISAY